jgi:uncharacterized low-complexity protein
MAQPNAARFVAAAILIGALAAPQALAQGTAPAGAPLQLADGDAAKGAQSAKKQGSKAGEQTARKPAKKGDGDEGAEFGVERPEPEGPDPYAPEGGDDKKGGKKGGDEGE